MRSAHLTSGGARPTTDGARLTTGNARPTSGSARPTTDGARLYPWLETAIVRAEDESAPYGRDAGDMTKPPPAASSPASPSPQPPAPATPPHATPYGHGLGHNYNPGYGYNAGYGYPPYPPQAPPPPPPPLPYHRLALITGRHRWWRPLAGTALVLAGAMAALMLVLLGAEIVGALLHRPVDADGFRVWGGIAETGLALLSLAVLTPVAFLAARWAQRRPAGTLSSVAGRLRWGWLGRCLAMGLPLVAGAFGVMMLLPTPSGGGTDDVEWVGLPDFLLGLAMVCVLVPFQAAAEEYVFRGWLTQAVGAWFRSPWMAILPQAPLFAAAHGWGTPWGFADLVVFGLVAGALTIRTGGLEAAIGLHALNNLLAMGVSAGIVGALASDETAADMDWMSVAVDVVMLCGYAALVLRVAGRRGIETLSAGTPVDGSRTVPPAAGATA
ncbi:CPBP family glutamic-type intramembrane protease [Streptomyces sp. NPDC023327]|uniref:CPBP family glutamic-type intramembrane protease n=1 Tax=Streptomyces sp. NPDC023327 TaxID=3157088 RepID=UPI0033E453DB